MLAIPAQHPDSVDVFHVDKDGNVFGPLAQELFPNGSVQGLLDAWLNRGELTMAIAPEFIPFTVPTFETEGVTYEEVYTAFEQRSILPMFKGDPETLTVWSRWPPEGTRWRSVFPEAESAEHYGRLKRLEENGFPVVVSANDPNIRGVPVVWLWPKPVGLFMAWSSGPDDIFAQAQMTAIARQSADNPEAALHRAQSASARYISEGRTTWPLMAFWPMYQQRGKDEALFLAEASLGVEAHSMAELARSGTWQALEETEHPVPIRRAWGAQGLFWALLLERLEAGQRFRVCKRCGRIIQGTSAKDFCSPADNELCYRERRTESKRHERMRR
jgi:hypothetical protein